LLHTSHITYAEYMYYIPASKQNIIYIITFSTQIMSWWHGLAETLCQSMKLLYTVTG